MINPMNWDDLRVAQAVASAGSLSGAAKVLGLSHPTVFRRLRRLESDLGVRLFERGPNGYMATEAGADALACIERMADGAHDLERRVLGRDLQPTGVVRLTTTDSLLHGLLTPLLGAFRATHPGIRLTFLTSTRPFDLGRREADIALRPANRPPETLVGRKVGRIRQAIYGAREGAKAVDLKRCDWIGPDETMGYRDLTRWLQENDLDARCHVRVDSVLAMQQAAALGLGAAILPCYLADRDLRLQRLSEPVSEMACDLWLLTHEDLRATARIRTVMEFMYHRIKLGD